MEFDQSVSVPKLFISLSLINWINLCIKKCLLKSNRIYHLTDPRRLGIGELISRVEISPKWWTLSVRQGGNRVIFFLSFLPHLLCISYLCIIFVDLLQLQTSRKTKNNEIRIQLDRRYFLLSFPIKEIRNICASQLSKPTREPCDCDGNFTRCSQVFLFERWEITRKLTWKLLINIKD